MSMTVAESIYEEGYQAGIAEIRHEDALEWARGHVLRLGRKLLGQADEAAIYRINTIDDLDYLDFLSDQLYDQAIHSWAELLEPLAPLIVPAACESHRE